MFKLTFAVLVAGLSLALATAKAVETPFHFQNSFDGSLDTYGPILIVTVVFTVVFSALILILLMLSAPTKLMRNKATEVVDQHIQSLIRRRAQLVRKDAYGGVQLEKWVREINYFIDNQLTPKLTAQERAALARHKSSVVSMIAVQVQRAAQDIPLFAQFDDNMSPVDFELFCAEQLKQSGWDAQITKASRDQGVDVIAEKNGLRIVLQCKLYTRPVGNKAVQEAAAAKAHEKADYGIVVTNSDYTSAAEQLASTNDILLLHYRDLTKLDTLLRKSAVQLSVQLLPETP